MVSQEKLSFTRADVLEKLWSRVCWLDKKISNRQTQFSKTFKERAMLIEKERRLCQSILSGLPVEKLEQRIAHLEEQLENSILIQREENE